MTANLLRRLYAVPLLCASAVCATHLSAAIADDDPRDATGEKKSKELNPTLVKNGLKQMALAMHNHHDVNGAFPAAASYDANQKKLLSWRVHILPFLDQEELYNQFRLNEPWDSAHNKRLIEKMPKIFAVGNQELQKAGKTVFLVPIGKDTVFGSREATSIQDITDGTSLTIMIVTVNPKHAVEWTKPEDWEFDEKSPFDKLKGEQGKGFMFCTCDGATHNFGKPLKVELLKGLLTRSGQELVSF